MGILRFLQMHTHFSSAPHLGNKSSNISRGVGILNKLRYCLPVYKLKRFATHFYHLFVKNAIIFLERSSFMLNRAYIRLECLSTALHKCLPIWDIFGLLFNGKISRTAQTGNFFPLSDSKAQQFGIHLVKI